MIQYGSQLVGHDSPNVERIPGSSPGHTANLSDGVRHGSNSAGALREMDYAPSLKKYQRTGQMLIRPLLFEAKQSAFDLARLFYAQYPDLNFADDLLDYHRTGFVRSKPDLFVMAKIVDWESEDGVVERMWFCRIAIGSLIDLLVELSTLPSFPRIAFCRNNRANKMRIYSIKRLCELAVRNAKAKGKIWAAAAA